MWTPEHHFNHGRQLASLGRHREALEAYERALALEPRHVEALNNRGLALAALGQHARAIESYDAALAQRPHYPRALNNRGLALAALGRHDAALESYDRALALEPGYLPALINSADSLTLLRRNAAALARLEQAVACREAGPLRLRIGLSLAAVGEHRKAIALFDAVSSAEPRRVDVGVALCKSLFALGDAAGTLAAAGRVLAIEPMEPTALDCQGLALQQLGRDEEALSTWSRLLDARPLSAEAFCNRATSLKRLGRIAAARASLDRAIAIDPALSVAHYNRAVLFDELGDRQHALEDCHRALTLRPDYLLALHLRGMILLSLERSDEARAPLEQALALARQQAQPAVTVAALQAAELFARAACCEWEGYAERVAELARAVDDGATTLPFLFICFSEDAQRQRRCAESASGALPQPPAIASAKRYGHDRIRIAYLCGEFREHAVAQLTVGLFERHDRTRFEVTGIALSADPNPGPFAARLRAAFDRYIEAHELTAQQIAQLMADLEIDIAIDLNGYTGAQRFEVFTRRPAPVQVSYLAFPGTTGSGCIDYLLADEVTVPAGAESHFTERIVRLPGCFMITDDRRSVPEVPPERSRLAPPSSAFVFCAFNNSYKITPPVFAVWLRLLHAVDGSVLWLRQRNALVAENLRAEASRAGIAPERLVFAPHASGAEHIARLRRADLFLDTYPYGAHSTAMDALRAGLPLVTCRGETFASRVCASALIAAGLPQLVTASLAEYESLALHLASAPDVLAALRGRVADAVNSALFDTDAARRHIEQAYERMWLRHDAGEPPMGFVVG